MALHENVQKSALKAATQPPSLISQLKSRHVSLKLADVQFEQGILCAGSYCSLAVKSDCPDDPDLIREPHEMAALYVSKP